METENPDQLFEFVDGAEKEHPKIIFTASAIAFDFDYVTDDPLKSRADEIRVLLVKNKKPPKNSKEGKPPGIGVPTGQFESKEAALSAAKRELEDETGCLMRRAVGKLFVVHKRLREDGGFTPNEIHVFLVEASEPMRKVREVEEIDASFEPWVPLRQVFEMPLAQDKGCSKKNPDGMYFSHRQRLYRAIDSMVYEPENLIDGGAAEQWLKPNRKALISAMVDLKNAGLLKEFLPKDDLEEAGV